VRQARPHKVPRIKHFTGVTKQDAAVMLREFVLCQQAAS